jgi:hypothetical protein
MRGRAKDCTHLPEPTGPEDDSISYTLTPAGQEAVAAAHHEAQQIAHRQAQAHQARARGKRAGTIHPRWRRIQLVPELRLCGLWLEAAGFELGQGYEVAVKKGRLVIRAL